MGINEHNVGFPADHRRYAGVGLLNIHIKPSFRKKPLFIGYIYIEVMG
jgi:hypothetical protein